MTYPDPETANVVAQSFGELAPVRIGLSAETRHRGVVALNRMLAHTLALRDLYRKNHWQTSGVTFYQLHLLFDKHYAEQDELADAIAERVQTIRWCGARSRAGRRAGNEDKPRPSRAGGAWRRAIGTGKRP